MRLTKQIDKKYYVIATQINFQKDGDNATHKLGQLEDIEDELGIDLITLFKALKNGVYSKENGYTEDDRLYVTNDALYHYGAFEFYYFKDYGKTWALTKEELK